MADRDDETATERLVSGTSWNEFCDVLKAAGEVVLDNQLPSDPATRAEGFRYLSRITRAGLEAFVEHADPQAPVLSRVVHETAKMGSDNPDNYYQNAAISGAHDYVIRGRRNTVKYLSFGTQIGHYGQGAGMPPSGFLDAAHLEIDDDGSFEIRVSCHQPASGNWLPMKPESGTLIVRQTFGDRDREQIAELTIERIGGDAAPLPLTAPAMDRGLEDASTLVGGAARLFLNWAENFRRHTNELPLFSPEMSTAFGGDPNILYYHSYWKLADDEALVIDAKPPACEHWNFQLNNCWMESLDYRYFRIHVNKLTARHRPDGSVRIVVAHDDPGVDNWIQTVGHLEGTMCFRWIRPDDFEGAPVPRTRVVKHAAVARLE